MMRVEALKAEKRKLKATMTKTAKRASRIAGVRKKSNSLASDSEFPYHDYRK